MFYELLLCSLSESASLFSKIFILLLHSCSLLITRPQLYNADGKSICGPDVSRSCREESRTWAIAKEAGKDILSSLYD